MATEHSVGDLLEKWNVGTHITPNIGDWSLQIKFPHYRDSKFSDGFGGVINSTTGLEWNVIVDSLRNGKLSYRQCIECLLENLGALQTNLYGPTPDTRKSDVIFMRKSYPNWHKDTTRGDMVVVLHGVYESGELQDNSSATAVVPVDHFSQVMNRSGVANSAITTRDQIVSANNNLERMPSNENQEIQQGCLSISIVEAVSNSVIAFHNSICVHSNLGKTSPHGKLGRFFWDVEK